MISKSGTIAVTKKITEKRLKVFGQVKTMEEGHVIRNMAFHQYQERDDEEVRKPCGKSLVNYGKCRAKGGGRIGQDKVEKRYGKCRVKGGGRIGQDKVEKRYGKCRVKGGGRIGQDKMEKRYAKQATPNDGKTQDEHLIITHN